MNVDESEDPLVHEVDGAHTDETEEPPDQHDVCVPTRSDWPRDEFLQWLDAVKRSLGIPSDNQLAAHLNIGHTLISGWRNGRQRPSFETLGIIAGVLDEDPRKLWVLTGLARAADVGLLDDESARPGTIYGIPAGMRELLDVYNDPRMTAEDRATAERAMAFLAAGMLADLDRREGRGAGNRGRNAS